jgi:hypothetical protein
MFVSGLRLFTSLFLALPRSNFMSVLPQITYGNIALIAVLYFHGYKKRKYWQIIEINGMFLNVVTFSVTKRSIFSTKKKVDSFKHFYLIFYDYLTPYC